MKPFYLPAVEVSSDTHTEDWNIAFVHVEESYGIDVVAILNTLQTNHPHSSEMQWRWQLLRNLVRIPLSGVNVQEYYQRLSRRIRCTTLAELFFNRSKDKHLGIARSTSAKSRHHHMFHRPTLFRPNVADNSVAASWVTTERQSVLAREVNCDAQQPIRQDLARAHPAKILKSFPRLKVAAIPNEGLKLLQGCMQILKASDLVSHGLATISLGVPNQFLLHAIEVVISLVAELMPKLARVCVITGLHDGPVEFLELIKLCHRHQAI
jgi:hypothetical protein